jgi:type II secretory pathway pseudopilin PulG
VSATAPVRRALPRPASAGRSRPRLVLVAPAHRVGRTPFLLLVGALLVVGLLMLVLLHTLAAQDAFRQTSLAQQLANLTDTEQQLQQQVEQDAAPAALQREARALGMVPSAVTSYRRLPDGRVIGKQLPASQVSATTTVLTPNTATSPTPGASPSASPSAASSPKPDSAASPAPASGSRHAHHATNGTRAAGR